MNDRKRSVLVAILLIFCFIYLVVRASHAAYESSISGQAENDLANWSIKINNQEINQGVTNPIALNYTVTDLTNVRSGKVAPGANLSYPITIDASGSEVAIKLTFSIEDKSVDPDKLLTLTSVNSSDLTVVRVGASSYSAIIPKASLSGNKTITLNLTWVDDGTSVEYTDVMTDDDFAEIEVSAIQYAGETLTPYSG